MTDVSITREEVVFRVKRIALLFSVDDVKSSPFNEFVKIAVQRELANDNIDWASARCLTYSKNYFQGLTLESGYTNPEQLTDVNNYRRLICKRLIYDGNETNKRTSNRPT